MQQPTLNDIERSIGRLEGKVEEGFKATNARLDKVNGRLDKGEDRINKVETFCDTMKGKIVASALIISGAVSIVGLLLQYYR